VCDVCWAAIPRIGQPFCQGCGRPFDPKAHAADVCGDCRTGQFRFDRARAVGQHVAPLRDLVLAFKFGGRHRLAEPLGRLLSEFVLAEGSPGGALARADAIVPVPLHRSRQRWRGYNQAELLAERLGEATGVPVAAAALRRVRDTKPQTELTPAQRRENVRGAFAVLDAETVQGRTLLVLDDVMTTGATLSECARVLKRAKAERVFALTVSRSTPDWDARRDLF
jgi:ComF family protein